MNGPPPEVGPRTPGHHSQAGATDTNHTSTLDSTDTQQSSAIESQQVSFWSVHEHVQPVLDEVRSWPMAGTPEWCEFADNDPVKLAALLDAARHWALRVETCQAARCEASHDVSAAEDWKSIGNEMWQRRGVYIRREVA